MKGRFTIKNRIKSVKNTFQITKAMQLVAASKMKRAQKIVLLSRPYTLSITEVMLNFLNHLEKKDIQFPLFKTRNIKYRGILVISTEKGLCGALNSNLFRKINNINRNKLKFISIGKKGTQFLNASHYNLLADFIISDKIIFSEVYKVVKFIINAYTKGIIDTVEILFTQFISTLDQKPILIKLLPMVNLIKYLKEFQRNSDCLQKTTVDIYNNSEMIICPNSEKIMEMLPLFFIKQIVYQKILEAKASEHSARMIAMKNATDNAKELFNNLTLEYNKIRQATITQEILEISAAANMSI